MKKQLDIADVDDRGLEIAEAWLHRDRRMVSGPSTIGRDTDRESARRELDRALNAIARIREHAPAQPRSRTAAS